MTGIPESVPPSAGTSAAPRIWQPHDPAPSGTHRATIPAGSGAGGAEVVLEATSAAALTWDAEEAGKGVARIRVRPETPATVRVAWRIPCVDAMAYWTPDSGDHRGLPPFWRGPRTSSLAKGAPVGCLVGAGDRSMCTFALAEVIRPVTTRAGVVEETGEFGFWAEHRAEPDTGLVLRLDLSGRPFPHALAGVAAWWAEGLPAATAREADARAIARMPAYSTWYAMQQHVDAAGVERQAAPAAGLGCETIIVDDGWHTGDRGRGYGYAGEWEPSVTAFPKISAHVARVRDKGLAYMLWYALPFVGRHTALWDRVQPYALARKDHMNAVVVDPRYPFIRDLLAGRVTRAVREWGADGVKIDFIDQFAVEDPPPPGPEADCATVEEGVRRLMAQLGERCPENVLVELRQPYVSPGLWPHATMIRASDCPLSAVLNRRRTVDLRLIAGPLAVHADMMMWHPAEPPERVAVQLINTLFAVPQISVDLFAQTPGQTAVLRFWLDFFRQHADVLQGGVFEPSRPDLGYPMVTARGGDTVIVGRYAPFPVPVEPGRELLIANADVSTGVLLDVPESGASKSGASKSGASKSGTATATVMDCQGRPISERAVELVPGVHRVRVPVGGLLTLVPGGSRS